MENKSIDIPRVPLHSATWFGDLLIALGVLGFVPGITTDTMLFGIFSASTFINIIYIATGAFAIWASQASTSAAKSTMKSVAAAYMIFALTGFVTSFALVVAIPVVVSDSILQICIAAVAAYLSVALTEASSGSNA